MEITIILKDGTEKILDLKDYSVSLTDQVFKGKEDHAFQDIEKILFNEDNFITQMVNGIVDCCAIHCAETDHKIELGSYGGKE